MIKIQATDTPPTASTIMPPARDPAIAVEEEFQAARQSGTAEALERFIQRHPESWQARQAKALATKPPTTGGAR